jgi:hypothetical protein
LGFLVTRKNPRKNALNVIQKGPINAINVKNTGARAKNVFFNVIIFLFWVDIILFLILAIGIILHYIG